MILKLGGASRGLLEHNAVDRQALRALETVLQTSANVAPAEAERPRDVMNQTNRQAQRRLKPSEVADLIHRYQSHETVYELGTRFGIHRSTVSTVLERVGIPRRYNLLTPEHVSETARIYGQGRSLARIVDQFRVNHSTVLNAFRKAGIPTRPRVGR